MQELQEVNLKDLDYLNNCKHTTEKDEIKQPGNNELCSKEYTNKISNHILIIENSNNNEQNCNNDNLVLNKTDILDDILNKNSLE